MVSGLGVVSAMPHASSGGGKVVDFECDNTDGPASISDDRLGSSTTSGVASALFSLSSDFDFLAFFRGGSGASEGSLVSSAWSNACTGLRFLRERRVGTGGGVMAFTPRDLAYSF